MCVLCYDASASSEFTLRFLNLSLEISIFKGLIIYKQGFFMDFPLQNFFGFQGITMILFGNP